jgi:lipoate-protein ligase A
VDAPTCRLLPFAVADGPHNMAADETLLDSAAAGLASLRFYSWSPATLSLGYFQPESSRREDLLLAQLPFVRRPSGGDTLVHHHELTYALALPSGSPWHANEPWPRRMHLIIAHALQTLGIQARLHSSTCEQSAGGPLCFRHFTPDDVLVGDAKIVGSAQRRRRGAMMQHGSILLAQSPYTPTLPGIRELTGKELSAEELHQAIENVFSPQTGWHLIPRDWTDAEHGRIQWLRTEKYSADAWNRKRRITVRDLPH